MAYIDKLTEKRKTEVDELLNVKIKEEHNSAYQANLSRAKSKKAKNACAGRYEGSWWRLWNGWVQGKIDNLTVFDSLQGNLVIGDIEGVKFQSCA